MNNKNNTQRINMTPSLDTVEFFKHISTRMNNYHKNIDKVKKYISRNKLRDSNKISNLVIMSVIWTAHQLGEYLTETDILVILGSEQEMEHTNIMSLDVELRNLPLLELMDVLNENG